MRQDRSTMGFAAALMIGVLVLLWQTVSLTELMGNEQTETIMVATQSRIPESEILSKSDLIVLGTITSVYPDGWNQESGERWSMRKDSPELEHPPAAFPIQRIEIAVEETLLSTMDTAMWLSNGRIEVVQIGNEIGKPWSDGASNISNGNRVVACLRSQTIGWRDGPQGRKEVVTLVHALNGLYLVDDDGRITNVADGSARTGLGVAESGRSHSVDRLRAAISAISLGETR